MPATRPEENNAVEPQQGVRTNIELLSMNRLAFRVKEETAGKNDRKDAPKR
jgi:hypothetical protein